MTKDDRPNRAEQREAFRRANEGNYAGFGPADGSGPTNFGDFDFAGWARDFGQRARETADSFGDFGQWARETADSFGDFNDWGEEMRQARERLNENARRFQEKQQRQRQAPPPRPDRGERTWADDLLTQAGPELGGRIFKALAAVLHPDAGGTTELMQHLNRARDRSKNR